MTRRGIGLGDGRLLHARDPVRVDDAPQIGNMTASSGDHPRYIGWLPLSRALMQKNPQAGSKHALVAEEGMGTMTGTFDLSRYLESLLSECRSAFGGRLLYMGLQGSYMRGEANEDSDIDIMLILDHLLVRDMDEYRQILNGIGPGKKSCGFICGRDEMTRWNPLEICQLRHTTRDLYGKLSDHLPDASREDEVNYVKLSLGNLYHELCHRYIHSDRAKNVITFRLTCKGLFYLIQNMHYLESGRFVTTRRELKASVSGEDRQMLSMAELPDGYDFDAAFSAVFHWCQSAFVRMERVN